ncbi:sensor histidine kinase [Microlunatus parietis]|uniref:Two-component system sensor histidine kinase DesK n=1 Tax=Microlunatus parietis TaxID=682979 RepID=A0A7Y9LC88_9ACTN|nr:sensor histidine kinase [Microlunatus parietis]NYE72572.1 two-component system sensor histidine kinase DesK [Microlunatus parietis]
MINGADLRSLPRLFYRHWWQVLTPLSLIMLGYPIRNAVEAGPALPTSMISFAGAVLFAAGFTYLMCWLRPAPLLVGPPAAAGLWLRRGLIIALAVLLIMLAQVTGPAWLSLFFHVGMAVGVMLPVREAYLGVAVLVVVLLVLGWPYGLSFLGLPVGLLGLWGAATIGQTANLAELIMARRRLAELAVAEERLRFARDLHDLLGHSLSLISLKTELGERLIDADPVRARTEIADAHAVARRSLREVREAVGGYRRPVLTTELDGARELLESAGIETVIDDQLDGDPIRHDAVLAWAVREAVTNVVRHSGAGRCRIELRRSGRLICLVVDDDGRGPARTLPSQAGPGSGLAGPGSGLAGLAERVHQADGATLTIEDLGPGFRLRVTVPAEPEVP